MEAANEQAVVVVVVAVAGHGDAPVEEIRQQFVITTPIQAVMFQTSPQRASACPGAPAKRRRMEYQRCRIPFPDLGDLPSAAAMKDI